jgi:hypothetical protein
MIVLDRVFWILDCPQRISRSNSQLPTPLTSLEYMKNVRLTIFLNEYQFVPTDRKILRCF